MGGIMDEEELWKIKSVANIAMDLADNELIRRSPNFDAKRGDYFYKERSENGIGFLIPEEFDLGRSLPYEVYQYSLMRQQDKQAQKLKPKLKNSSGCDSNRKIFEQYFKENAPGQHDAWWDEAAGKPADEREGLADKLRKHGRNLLRQAVREHQKSRGTVPAHLRELLDQFLREPTVPWPEVLRNICVNTRQTKIGRGLSRPNRRLMAYMPQLLPYPGYTKDRKFTMYFALDTSGSMSTNDLKLAMSELCHMAKADQDIRIFVMYCDTSIGKMYEVKSVDDVDWDVVGRGGTDFNEPFKHIRQHLRKDEAGDILIYATDGYAPEPEPENRIPIPVIWLVTPGGRTPSPDYGIHIPMEPFDVTPADD
jgi:predicted metal-dependent peptidase